MQLTHTDHIAVIASDFTRSKNFYTQILGFTLIREYHRPDRGTWQADLRLNNTQIELFGFPTAPKRPTNPEALGCRHFAFATPDIQAAVAHLNKNGISTEPIRINPHTQKPYTFFRDPDDLPIELCQT